MKHMNYELSTKEFHLGHGPVGEREGWQTQLEMLHWTHAFQIVCGRTPAAIQHLASWGRQKQVHQQAHLLGHGAPKVLQHIQHLEDVKCMHHLYPLESTCLREGWEREAGTWRGDPGKR